MRIIQGFVCNFSLNFDRCVSFDDGGGLVDKTTSRRLKFTDRVSLSLSLLSSFKSDFRQTFFNSGQKDFNFSGPASSSNSLPHVFEFPRFFALLL